MRLVIELKRGEVPEVILNNLYKNTQLQDTFGMNMVALVDGQPRLLNLKQMVEYFLLHRREVVTRRTVFQLRKARERGHRSEEHTSELQSLMRISYAVFCLNKKKTQIRYTNTHTVDNH